VAGKIQIHKNLNYLKINSHPFRAGEKELIFHLLWDFLVFCTQKELIITASNFFKVLNLPRLSLHKNLIFWNNNQDLNIRGRREK